MMICSDSAETVGSSMLIVDALNERVAALYEAFGFQRLPESLRLVRRQTRRWGRHPGGGRVPESGTLGSVRGVLGNGHP
jgi:hypothetical protein